MAETEIPAAPCRPAADYLLLEAGDRLTRREFERRYAACPQLKKAELIEGVVYLPSPVRHESHGRPHAMLLGPLLLYAAHAPGVGIVDNATGEQQAFAPRIRGGSAH